MRRCGSERMNENSGLGTLRWLALVSDLRFRVSVTLDRSHYSSEPLFPYL